MGSWAISFDPPAEWSVRIGDTRYAVTVDEEAITVDGAVIDLALEYTPGDRVVVTAEVDGKPLTVKVAPRRRWVPA